VLILADNSDKEKKVNLQPLVNTYKSSKNKFKINLAHANVINLISWFALFMSFNNLLVLGTNISMFLFIYLLIQTVRKYSVIQLAALPHWAVLFFALGAIISVYDVNASGEDARARSMSVIVNFIYWSVLIITVSNLAPKIGLLRDENLYKMAGYIAFGVFLCVLFYEFKNVLSFPFLKRNTPNSYAFVLVCYSSIAMVYLRKKYSRNAMLFGLSVILFSMLFLERRAGFMLVASSTFFALNFDKLTLKTVVSMLFVGLFGFVLLQLDLVKGGLKNASPRIYETIYESENISTQDQSYLTRVAMIEKGMVIFQENPLTGIGLNNFSNHYVKIPGNFIGSDLVVQKELNDKSGHNSYIALLAEGGLLVLVPFLILLFYNIYHFVKDFKKRTRIESAFYWSFIAMCIHIYFISEIYNVFAWFLISMVTAISIKYSRIDKMKQYS